MYVVALAATTSCWVIISLCFVCYGRKKLPLQAVIAVDVIALLAWLFAVARYLKLYSTMLFDSCGQELECSGDDILRWCDNFDYLECQRRKRVFGFMVVEVYGPCALLHLLKPDEISP